MQISRGEQRLWRQFWKTFSKAAFKDWKWDFSKICVTLYFHFRHQIFIMHFNKPKVAPMQSCTLFSCCIISNNMHVAFLTKYLILKMQKITDAHANYSFIFFPVNSTQTLAGKCKWEAHHFLCTRWYFPGNTYMWCGERAESLGFMYRLTKLFAILSNKRKNNYLFFPLFIC